jgi:drug/metabolite transporter (DMT)-like permease
MNQNEPSRELGVSVAIPTLFVLLWSSGFIAAKVGLSDSGPLTFLTLRFALVTVLMLIVALAMRAPWPRSWREVGHLAVVGLLMQAIYFGAAWVSMSQGVGAGTAALIVSMQPVLTAIVAGRVLGERVGPRQWLGLAVGFAGVVLVVSQKLALGLGSPAGMAWSFISLLGITAGTLYQKRFCPTMDPRTGGLVQFITATMLLLPLALLLEDRAVSWSLEFVGALLYVAVFLSLISITLLTVMIKRGQASRMTSLFFLVPPLTAVLAWIVLGETMSGLAIVGLVFAAIGVALVVVPARKPRVAV